MFRTLFQKIWFFWRFFVIWHPMVIFLEIFWHEFVCTVTNNTSAKNFMIFRDNHEMPRFFLSWKMAKIFKVIFDHVPTPTPPQIFSSSESKFFPLSFELFKIDLSRCEHAENRILLICRISKFLENSRKKNFFSKTVTKFQTGLQVLFSIFPFFKFALASLSAIL